MEIRTPVLTPVSKWQWGYVTVETLARRSGPGTSYPEYREPLHKGERVYAKDACTDGQNIWVMIGPEVWAASLYESRVLISGEFIAKETCDEN